MSRFVRPDTVILPLTEGDTLTVKARLNAGETQDMYDRMALRDEHGRRVIVDGLSQVDLRMVNMARATAYLLDWTFTEGPSIRGRSVAEVEAALRQLDPDDLDEVIEAIDGHIELVEAARAEKKRRRAGAIASSSSSTSPAGVTGATSGSTNSTPMSSP